MHGIIITWSISVQAGQSYRWILAYKHYSFNNNQHTSHIARILNKRKGAQRSRTHVLLAMLHLGFLWWLGDVVVTTSGVRINGHRTFHNSTRHKGLIKNNVIQYKWPMTGQNIHSLQLFNINVYWPIIGHLYCMTSFFIRHNFLLCNWLLRTDVRTLS